MRDLIIYTDGSVYPNPGGVGGWAFVALDYNGKDDNYEYGSYALKTTNNRMELTAAINALGLVDRGDFVTIVTDSQYVQRCMNRRNWPESKPNADLGRILMDTKRGRFFEVKMVAGHSGDKWNDRAHELANQFRLDGVGYEKRRQEESAKRTSRLESALSYSLSSAPEWTTSSPVEAAPTNSPTPASTTTSSLWESTMRSMSRSTTRTAPSYRLEF